MGHCGLLCADSHAGGFLKRWCLHASVRVCIGHKATDGQCKCQYCHGKNHGVSLVMRRS